MLPAVAVALALVCAGLPAWSQAPGPVASDGETLVTLDFTDAELSTVIETIARATNRNFIYDDRVRGRVTIVSPDPVPVEQAYAVFESVLLVKGFTTVETPGGAIKVIPVREAKESSIETVQSSRRPPNRDRFVTRLIPLNYIDAESIVNTLKPLVSKDAAMAAYQPTNTVILTESASNIRRLIAILESIDVETYKEELTVIPIEYADASALADQVSEIYGAEVTEPGVPVGASARGAAARRAAARRAAQRQGQGGQSPSRVGPPVRILTDERTNSLLVLAPRQQLEEVRRLVTKLDVPVTGGGRIHVYYLNNANAEDIAQTLSSLVGGQGSAPPNGGGEGAGAAEAIRSAVTGLSGGISVTADPATNALVIQASQEGFSTLAQVIEKLDVERPQVSVEALIMEVDVTNSKDLGFSALLRTINGDTDFAVATATGGVSAATGMPTNVTGPLVSQIVRNTRRPTGETDDQGNPTFEGSGSVIDGIIRLTARRGDTNVLSAPHILTSDNEEAEIRVGDNIPIISSRVEQPTGAATGLSSSVNVERQDIGVTLRVTPQITEGDTLRLDIFQEVTQINESLAVGDAEDVGVALSSRRIENTVVVKDGETVAIGGLIRDDYQDTETKVPWLGDVPILGWLFKSTSKSLTKTNLIVFLTPRVVRTPLDLELDTIERRENFRQRSGSALDLSEAQLEQEVERLALAEAEGRAYTSEYFGNPVRGRMAEHAARYPTERILEIREIQEEERREAALAAELAPDRYYLQAAVFSDPDAAAETLTELIDSGFDGTLLSAPAGDTVIYEIRLGPYVSLQEATRVGKAVRRAHGLLPSVLIQSGRDDDEDER